MADSIPKQILHDWREEQRQWYQAHGLTNELTPEEWHDRYQEIHELDRQAFQRRNARRLFLEVDKGHGSCLLRSATAQDILASAMMHFHGDRCWCGDFAIMPNQTHWMIQPIGGYELEDVVGSVKRYAAGQCGKHGLSMDTDRFWQTEAHDRLIRDVGELMRIRQYIAANPEKAGVPAGQSRLFRCEWLPERAGEAS